MKYLHKILFVLFVALVFGGLDSVAQAQNFCPACGASLKAEQNCQAQPVDGVSEPRMHRGGLGAEGMATGQRMLMQNRRLRNGNGQGLAQRNGQVNARQNRGRAMTGPTLGQGRASAMNQSRRAAGPVVAEGYASRPAGRGMAAGMGMGRMRAGGMGMGRMRNRMSEVPQAPGNNRNRQRTIQ